MIGNLPKALSPERQNDLINKMSLGDIEAKKLLIKHNLRLIKHVMYILYISYNKDDFFSIGENTLIRAIEYYNQNKGVKLSTYLSKCIANEFIKELNKQKTLDVVSLEGPCLERGNEGINRLKDTIPTAFDMGDIIKNLDNKKVIEKLLSILDETEKLYIILTFGLIPDCRIMSQTEVATFFNVTPAAISKRILRAFNKIRENKTVLDGIVIDNNLNNPSYIELFNCFEGHDEKEIMRAISMLNEKNRTMLELRYGLNRKKISIVDIAIIFNTPYKNIYKNIKRTKKKILRMLNGEKIYEPNEYLTPNIRKKIIEYTRDVSKQKLINQLIELDLLDVVYSFDKKIIFSLIDKLNDPIDKNIMLLKLGYYYNVFFQNEIIATLLEISENELNKRINNIREYYNNTPTRKLKSA